MAGPSREQELSPFLPGQHRALSLGPEPAVRLEGWATLPALLPSQSRWPEISALPLCSFLPQGRWFMRPCKLALSSSHPDDLSRPLPKLKKGKAQRPLPGAPGSVLTPSFKSLRVLQKRESAYLGQAGLGSPRCLWHNYYPGRRNCHPRTCSPLSSSSNLCRCGVG